MAPIMAVHGIVAGVGWLTAPPGRYMGNAEFVFNDPLWSRPGRGFYRVLYGVWSTPFGVQSTGDRIRYAPALY